MASAARPAPTCRVLVPRKRAHGPRIIHAHAASSTLWCANRSNHLDGYLQALYSQASQPLELEAPSRDSTRAVSHQGSYDRGAHHLVGLRPGAARGDAAVAANDVSTEEQLSFQEARNPSRLRFEDMYRQLASWRTTHLSCHIPRNCYDAPLLLGAWVRHMRRLQKARRLPQWQVDRLNLLGFEWRMDDATAKWINTYHQARGFRDVYGHLDVANVQQTDKEHGRRFGDLARWLEEQADAFAAGKLTEQQIGMLKQVGATLKIPRAVAEQHIQLQGLNAHERKLRRREFRAEVLGYVNEGRR